MTVPPHLAESWAHGTFFIAIATLQLAWGAWIYARPGRLGFRSGAAVSTAVIAVWIASRTVGVPVGPDQWEAEPVGALDLAATVSEGVIAFLCGAFLAAGGDRPAVSALPARFPNVQPLALAVMFAGLLALFLGGHHH